MIKYKRNSVLLKVVCAVLISTPAFADEKNANFMIWDTKWTLSVAVMTAVSVC